MATAISVSGVSKSFLLPHERRTTLKEYFLHPFRRTTFERQRALVEVSFEIDQGEFFGLIGPNGSGKSTLLRVLAGIYPPDEGSVRIDGVLSPFIELGVGFNYELNARDNVLINGTLLGLSRRELERKFDDIFEFAELARFADQKLKNYSSGMLLRLAYSIAIQVPFDILLLDEVLAVGDSSFQAKCFATFESFREQGKTVVFVSHDLASVAQYCDRVLYLETGVAEAIGPADDVLDAYRKRGARMLFTPSRERERAREPKVHRARTQGLETTAAVAVAEPPRLVEVPTQPLVDPFEEFHNDHYLRHNQRRLEHLASLDLPIAGRTVLEVGAGIGDHTSFFLDRGCSVFSTDARADNLAILRRRYPHIASELLDLDNTDPEFRGMSEIVHCYGLLYHLARPAEALEFLAPRCQSLLLLETVVSFGDDESVNLVEEPSHHPSQALRGVGCRPTRPWLLRELQQRFEHVYIPATQPWHPEFPLDWTVPPETPLPRSIFIASRARLDNPALGTDLPSFQVRH
jgi:ABC-type polysaccharide/polyol phosphate transport system ATPase subunit